MGACKKCGNVVSALYMKDGICPDCLGLTSEEVYSSNSNSNSNSNTQTNAYKNEIKNNEVKIVDIQMPFMSMVIFMIKWALAAIPAFIILFIIYFTFASIITAYSMKQVENSYKNSSYNYIETVAPAAEAY